MSDLGEVCMHQGVDNGPHALFKEKWDRCKNCTYDPENNKKCPDYVKTSFYSQYNISKSVSFPPQNCEDVRA